MTSRPLADSEILLWETAAGLRCTLARRTSPPFFEITVQRGADILQRVAFDHDADAADFAIAAMHDGSRVSELTPTVPTAPAPLLHLNGGFGGSMEVAMERSALTASRPTDAHPDPAFVPRVIVADPDDDTRLLYRESFLAEGWDVVDAADGREALVQTLVSAPSLLVTELRLPLVDGYSLCEVIRRDAATRSLPILVVTTETSVGDVVRAGRAGATVVLQKPAEMETVLAEARRLCAGSPVVNDEAASAALRDPAATGRALKNATAFRRFDTGSRPHDVPNLVCPSCGRVLSYLQSRVGGVNSRHPEQWDLFVCQSTCGSFEYRHRTRKLRPAEGW